MFNNSNDINVKSRMLKDNADSIDRASKISAAVLAVAGAVGGFLSNGIMGAIGGLLLGGAIGFAVINLGGGIAKVLRGLGDISDGVANTSSDIEALDKKLDKKTAELTKTIKTEIENINVVAEAPVEVKEEKVEEKVPDTPVAKKEEPKEEKAPVIPEIKKEEKVKEPAEEKKPENKDEEAEAPKKTITFLPSPSAPKSENNPSPFASAKKETPAKSASPFASAKKEEPKNEPTSPFASSKKETTSEPAQTKRLGLYRCDVCGNMVNQTPCPRCAAKNKAASGDEETPSDTKGEQNSSIWAAATKPATVNELSSPSSNASAFKKPEITPKEEAPAAPAETDTIRRNGLYRCNVCGNMVNKTPCPRCDINKKKNEKSNDKDEKEANPIWASTAKSGGSTGGSKLLDSSNSIVPTWSSPLKAAETAKEAPSWAKPAPSVTNEVDETPEPEKAPETERRRPIWETKKFDD